MASNSNIEWTHDTRNLWMGCTKVHEGCDNCYAEALTRRWGNDLWGNDKPRKIVKSVWSDLLRSQAMAKAEGIKRRVFVGSLMDWAEKPKQLIDTKGNLLEETTYDLLQRFFNEIVPACPDVIYLMLTKRPSRINKVMPEHWHKKVPDNIMFGTSPVNPETFKNLVGHLKKVNGNPKLFLSVEPQLENISPTDDDLNGIHWVIQGGESGPKKRPFNTAWARVMRDACIENGVPYFFKQIDKVQPIPPDLMVRQFPVYHG